MKRSIQTIPVPQNINPELKRYLEELSRQIYEVAKRQIIPFDLDMGGNYILNAGNLMQTISEVNVTSDCDYVDFTGLDINSDWFYILFATIKNPTASDCNYYIFVEGDYTLSNYYMQELVVSGTSQNAQRYNFASVAWTTAGDRLLATAVITRDPAGYFRYYSNISRKTGSSHEICIKAGSKTATVSNITQIRISAQQTGGIGAGSKFILARPRS